MKETKDKYLEELKGIKLLLACLLFKDDQKDMEMKDKMKLLHGIGLTQTEIAKIVGIDRSNVSRKLNPQKKNK